MQDRALPLVLQAVRGLPHVQKASISQSPTSLMLLVWQSWKTKFKDYMGDGLKHDGRTLTAAKVSDGLFIVARELVGGFSIVEAESHEHAIELARQCPITFVPNFSIEIREML